MVSYLVPDISIFIYAWVNGTSQNTTHKRIHTRCTVGQLGTVFLCVNKVFLL